MPEIPTGRALLDSPNLLRKAGIDYGMTVADLGCGTLGHFAFPAAHLVGPEGKVYAVDILPSALAAIESRIKVEKVNNVKTVWGDLERPNGVRIPANSVHLVILVNVPRLLKKTPEIANQVKQILKTKGRALVIDWQPDSGGLGPDADKRVSSEEIEQIFTDHGFLVKTEFDAGPNHWGLIVEKP